MVQVALFTLGEARHILGYRRSKEGPANNAEDPFAPPWGLCVPNAGVEEPLEARSTYR